MPYQNYRGLIVWKEAHKFVLDVYQSTKDFPVTERYGITSQIRRAAVSIPNNIVEGNTKTSVKDQLRFCEISRGSISECGYLLELSRDLGYLPAESHSRLEAQLNRVEYLLLRLMSSQGRDLRMNYTL
ncbi:MAG: S23 ribosomal protein [Candidatus Uhrbacteria bacterium GW2011_GWA2_52_8d]|uniref:S23 ribosomal protein n=1 Tax=Candidatus Uhrbacteria bacterium GW2011_GWA2_52_8d TaxID=1618979 RepID=A0A0G1XKH7_9BACT|nr:MAG: S23 ribosomal protein [Candidatus Uhrbacteria bacterium GW2011_GWA2_52_8d]